jgi:hypothetical protein
MPWKKQAIEKPEGNLRLQLVTQPVISPDQISIRIETTPALMAALTEYQPL